MLLSSISVRQARRVVSRELAAMSGVVTGVAAPLAKTRRDTAATLAQARRGEARQRICGYATVVSSDAQTVSAYRSGMAADTGSLQGYLGGLRTAMRTLSGQLRAVRHGQPGYHGGSGHPAPGAVARQLHQARLRITVVLAGASSRISQVNRAVRAAYRLSGRASAAGHCRSAAPVPPALPPARLGGQAALIAPAAA